MKRCCQTPLKVGLLPFNQVLSKSYRRPTPCFKNWSSSCFGMRLIASERGKHAHCCRLDGVISLSSPWRLFSPHPGSRGTAVADSVYQVIWNGDGSHSNAARSDRCRLWACGRRRKLTSTIACSLRQEGQLVSDACPNRKSKRDRSAVIRLMRTEASPKTVQYPWSNSHWKVESGASHRFFNRKASYRRRKTRPKASRSRLVNGRFRRWPCGRRASRPHTTGCSVEKTAWLVSRAALDVHLWHFSDIPPALTNVRYWG